MQKKSVKRYKEKHNITIVRDFEDKAISGALGFERPDFKEMIESIDEVDGIILYDWDRISREEEFAVSLMYALRKKNKYVIESASGNKLDFNQLQYRMMTFFKSVMASEERLKIKKRQKDGIIAFKEEHGRWGRFIFYGENSSGKKISKESFWKLYEQYRLAKISKSGIARILKMSRNTLYERLKEEPNKLKEIEDNLES